MFGTVPQARQQSRSFSKKRAQVIETDRMGKRHARVWKPSLLCQLAHPHRNRWVCLVLDKQSGDWPIETILLSTVIPIVWEISAVFIVFIIKAHVLVCAKQTDITYWYTLVCVNDAFHFISCCQDTLLCKTFTWYRVLYLCAEVTLYTQQKWLSTLNVRVTRTLVF